MISAIHVEHALSADLSNRWFERDEALWRAGLAFAFHFDVPLLALVYQRLREVRDSVAREAFERQLPMAVVARERRATLRARRPQAPHLITARDLWGGSSAAPAGGKLCSS